MYPHNLSVERNSNTSDTHIHKLSMHIECHLWKVLWSLDKRWSVNYPETTSLTPSFTHSQHGLFYFLGDFSFWGSWVCMLYCFFCCCCSVLSLECREWWQTFSGKLVSTKGVSKVPLWHVSLSGAKPFPVSPNQIYREGSGQWLNLVWLCDD